MTPRRTPCGGRARRPRPRRASRPGSPSSSNSRWSELPLLSSRTQLTGTSTRPAAASSSPSTLGRGALTGERSQNGRSRPDLVEREREVEPVAAAAGAGPAGERQRAEVVRRAGVDALLGAGRDEPDVAARPDPSQAPGQRGHHAEAGGVVVRAGAGRSGVRVRHDDPQAGARGVVDADHVARAAAPGHVELLDAHAQAGAPEHPPHQAVRPAPRSCSRRAAAPSS